MVWSQMDGHVYMWGDNMYEIEHVTPQVKAGLPTNIVDVAIGNNGTHCGYYALDANGGLWAWGYNFYGALGVGLEFRKTSWISTPQFVGSGFTSISADGAFALAIQGKAVPEPVSLSLLIAGAAGVLSRRRR
jgi:hypothetical protein